MLSLSRSLSIGIGFPSCYFDEFIELFANELGVFDLYKVATVSSKNSAIRILI